MLRSGFPAFVLAVCIAASPAFAACPSRLGVGYGDTLHGIAVTCGTNVEAIRALNPGLSAQTLRAGAIINVPPPYVPTSSIEYRRSRTDTAPTIVPPAIGGVSSTVILPPARPPVPRQHILRGFGDEPGQLPLPPGHSLRVP